MFVCFYQVGQLQVAPKSRHAGLRKNEHITVTPRPRRRTACQPVRRVLWTGYYCIGDIIQALFWFSPSDFDLSELRPTGPGGRVAGRVSYRRPGARERALHWSVASRAPAVSQTSLRRPLKPPDTGLGSPRDVHCFPRQHISIGGIFALAAFISAALRGVRR